MKRTVGIQIILFFAIGVAGYAVYGYGMLPLGALLPPAMKSSFLAHATGIYIHVFAALLALVLGPLQFSARLRNNYLRLHRWSGRIYLSVGVLVGGVAGLNMSQYAYGGAVARLGFAALALCWLFTGVRAFVAIRNKDILTHRRWMIRNYALTFAAVTLRIYIPTSMLAGIDFDIAYPVIAWLCWLPNIMLAEWLLVGGTKTQVSVA